MSNRKYRVREGEGAPLRETIAAAIVHISNINHISNNQIIFDPCCGSGTLLIESFMKLTK